MVLQEARRLLRSDSFLEKVKERNVNLYNQLKDDIVRAAVLKDMSKGKSEEVKFTLSAAPNPFTRIYNDPIYTKLLKVQKQLNTNIANNVIFGFESIAPSSEVKFTLSEFNDEVSLTNEEARTKLENKKYLNNFSKLFKTYKMQEYEVLGLIVPDL